jgi:hypothetical protein
LVIVFAVVAKYGCLRDNKSGPIRADGAAFVVVRYRLACAPLPAPPRSI